MDATSFERVYDSFQKFHAIFAPSFGRKQWREHSRNYLQALLVQAQERRNAENLSESVGVSARAMQRFLTEARWSDDTVTGLQVPGPQAGGPRGRVGVRRQDFPKQGRKSAGVARQYCGRLGKVANCQAGMFLAYVSPLGRALVDKRLYLPQSGPRTAAGARRRRYLWRGGVTGPRRSWLWRCWSGPCSWATSEPGGLPETRLRDVAVLPGLLGGPGDALRAVPGGTTVWPLELAWPVRNIRGRAPANPS